MKIYFKKKQSTVLEIFRLYFIVLITILSFSSCKKYLSEKSNSTLTVPTTVEDLQALLDDALVMNRALTPSYGEASADDFFLLQANFDGIDAIPKDIYRWIPREYFFPSNDWSKGYAPIYNSNYCLEMLEKIVVTNENRIKWNNVKGSAHYYRAFNFLNLLWNHVKSYDESSSASDLGLALRLQAIDFNIPSTRSTSKESYDQVISDAKISLPYLPDLPSITTFRPSKAAGFGLLARTYLSMRQYDSAYKYAELCLSFNNQLIDYKMNTADADIISNINSGNNAVFRVFNRETIFYSEMNTFALINTPTYAKIDTNLVNLYSSTDLRKTGFLRPDGNYRRFRGSYAQSATVLFSGIATDEIYLIKAECLARGINGNAGDRTASMAVLNTLLVKRHASSFTGLTAVDANDALNKILTERRKELLMRGLRWMDIKRLNKEGANLTLLRIINGQNYTLQPNANYYALPLPTDIINLTKMPQNPY